MNAKTLAGLVADVIKTGNARALSPEENSQFHREFESEVAEKIERMRSEKRRAYEELKNIAIR